MLAVSSAEVVVVRAGVVLTDLRPAGQAETLPGLGPPGEGRNLGPTLDAVAARFGVGSIGLGYGGIGTPPSWQMRLALLSRYLVDSSSIRG